MMLKMNGYLSLDLDDLVIDPALMARLPAGLAAYYLALPLACEDGAISVAMAYPENKMALAVLGNLFGAPIVFVRAPAAAVRRALSRYNATAPARSPRVLAWSADEEHAGLVAVTAARFATMLAATVTSLTSLELDLEGVLTVAREGQYCLTVIHPPWDAAPAQILRRAPTPLLLVRNMAQKLHRILIVLRGYSADEQILNWLAPLLEPEVSVTLLPLPLVDEASGQRLLLLNDLEKDHLQDCLLHPALRNARTFVRLRQGQIVNQVAEETCQGLYDLVVIAAEGYGRFVSRVVTTIEQQGGQQHSFFILKPPTPGKTG